MVLTFHCICIDIIYDMFIFRSQVESVNGDINGETGNYILVRE